MKKVLFWVSPIIAPSALKAVFDDSEGVRMILFNTKYPSGTTVEGRHFFSIAIGHNPDYDCVNKEDFESFIKTICNGADFKVI